MCVKKTEYIRKFVNFFKTFGHHGFLELAQSGKHIFLKRFWVSIKHKSLGWSFPFFIWNIFFFFNFLCSKQICEMSRNSPIFIYVPCECANRNNFSYICPSMYHPAVEFKKKKKKKTQFGLTPILIVLLCLRSKISSVISWLCYNRQVSIFLCYSFKVLMLIYTLTCKVLPSYIKGYNTIDNRCNFTFLKLNFLALLARLDTLMGV